MSMLSASVDPELWTLYKYNRKIGLQSRAMCWFCETREPQMNTEPFFFHTLWLRDSYERLEEEQKWWQICNFWAERSELMQIGAMNLKI